MNNKKYAFCVLGSFLYMFQMGSLALLGPRKGKSVCAINLIDQTETKSSSSSTLGGKVLDQIPNMLCPKFHTRAILTPDAKRILVFSKTIMYADPDPVDFELFYPNRKKNPWKRLPSPKHSLNPNAGFFSNEYTIDDFTFITDSVFLIQTDKIGIFALDVNADDPTWQKIDSSDPIPFDSPFFVIEDHKLCIAADILREFRRVFKASKFPTSSFADDFKYGSCHLADSHIIYKAGELFDNVCFQTGISKDTDYAHICLDVCRSVLDKYTRLEINPIIKTFKFVLDGYRCFDLYSIFSSNIIPEQDAK